MALVHVSFFLFFLYFIFNIFFNQQLEYTFFYELFFLGTDHHTDVEDHEKAE